MTDRSYDDLHQHVADQLLMLEVRAIAAESALASLRRDVVTDEMVEAAARVAEKTATIEMAGWWDGWGARPHVDNWPEVVRAAIEAALKVRTGHE